MKRSVLFILFVSMVTFFACSKETSFETGISTPAAGTLKDTLGNCDSMSVNGAYIENQQLTASNTVTVTVNVTTAGNYSIKTDSVNGFSFADSGFFTAPGTYQINLKGSGKPITATTSTFMVSFGTSFCSFDVTVIPATTTPTVNNSDSAWMFSEGTMFYHGHVDSALFTQSGSVVYLNIYGKPITNDTTFYVQLQQTSPTAPPSGTYSTSTGTAVFEFKTPAGNTIYDSRQTDGSNLTFTVVSYDAATKVLQATFTGTVKDDAGGTKTVSSGTMKVQVQ